MRFIANDDYIMTGVGKRVDFPYNSNSLQFVLEYSFLDCVFMVSLLVTVHIIIIISLKIVLVLVCH